MGIPVIATRTAYANFAIQDGINGYQLNDPTPLNMENAVKCHFSRSAVERQQLYEQNYCRGYDLRYDNIAKNFFALFLLKRLNRGNF
jgi:glycosyltransferase involved in cell wall biosynthesis